MSAPAAGDKVSETIAHMRTIVVKFASDAVRAFPEVAARHESIFRYYLTLQSRPDTDAWNMYLYLCKKLPDLAVPIWLEDAALFQPEYMAQHSLLDMCFLPGLDFREFFLCPGLSDDMRGELWLYVQGLLMLTMNEANPNLSDMRARAARAMESAFEEGGDAGDGDASALFSMLDSEDLSEKIEEVSERLNAFFAAEGAAAEGDMDADEPAAEGAAEAGMDTDGAPGAAPRFDSEAIKQFMSTVTDTKLGKIAAEVAQDIFDNNPEMVRELEEFYRSHEAEFSKAQGKQSKLSMMQFLMRKGLSMKQLFSMMMDKFKARIQSGQYSYAELAAEFPALMRKMQGMTGRDMRDMFKGMGMGKGLRPDTGAMQRAVAAENTRARLRAKVQSMDRERRAASAVLNMSAGVLGGGFDPAEAARQAQDASLAAQRDTELTSEEQRQRWQQQQREVEELFAGGAGLAVSGGKKKQGARGR